ncbi:site-specific integrase [Haloferax sp. ATB1]|uniref:tyrosine-type recombinase/integrase n=1 Tax=Haloferax sp. ATB1 TaxID=1508454 RepID=UPI0005B1DA32|nr:site-specific integrase [Haloferax sp. ATB1]
MSDELRDLSPREARERFLARRAQTQAKATIRSYRNRLNAFVHWCESENVESMAELNGWLVDEYQAYRERQGMSPSTVKGAVVALRQLVKYCHRIEAVDPDLLDKIKVPKLSKAQQTSDETLAAEDALNLLSMYRESRRLYGTAWHAFLEVTWHTGARMGGIRALDLGDFDREERSLEFRHQPETETPLKNKEDGERVVGLPEPVVDALDEYIARERSDKRDEYGRQPLFSCRQGRPSRTTIRSWSYLGTQPCLYRDCPHGRERHACSYTTRGAGSKCPSSRSPHAIRTGSITWQLDRGVPIELVAERVNATPSTIRRYYDKADVHERFRERRRELSASLDIQNHD